MSMMVSFVLSFFPRDVLDEILNLIESVSGDFPSYSYHILTLKRSCNVTNLCYYGNKTIKLSRIYLQKNIIFQKLYIYEERKKTIVHTNNSFQLWMINTWVTHLKIKSLTFSNLHFHGKIRDFT